MMLSTLLSAALLGQVYPSPQTPPAPVSAPAPVTLVYTVGDPTGFGVALNAERARRGLRPLACDAELCRSATANSRRGFGHFVRKGRGQCVGYGPAGSMLGLWMADPAHARILMDPTTSRYGIGAHGRVCTVDVD